MLKVMGGLLVVGVMLLSHSQTALAFGKAGTECTECHTDVKNAQRKFHTGRSSECNECHVGKGAALRASDASSVCLRCHEAPVGVHGPKGHYVATNSQDIRRGMAPSQLTPGGDFGWLKKNYYWKVDSESRSSIGERHGHNIVAADFGYIPDIRYKTSSNGSFPSQSLSCVSCHDPHAKIAIKISDHGSYRLLAGKGYVPNGVAGIVFTMDPPVAVSPDEYNRSEHQTDTRVAYGEGMSEWCGNCHISGCEGKGHAAGKCANCGGEIISNYNVYIMSGNINGLAATSFTSLVPFEEGSRNSSFLALHAQNNGSFMRGPEPGANVMCLTCHRAHASGWDSIGRWNMEADFIVYEGKYPGIDNGSPVDQAQGRTSIETRVALYNKPLKQFAAYQRGLCNKCHTKD